MRPNGSAQNSLLLVASRRTQLESVHAVGYMLCPSQEKPIKVTGSSPGACYSLPACHQKVCIDVCEATGGVEASCSSCGTTCSCAKSFAESCIQMASCLMIDLAGALIGARPPDILFGGIAPYRFCYHGIAEKDGLTSRTHACNSASHASAASSRPTRCAWGPSTHPHLHFRS